LHVSDTVAGPASVVVAPSVIEYCARSSSSPMVSAPVDGRPPVMVVPVNSQLKF
jgi:hypothetical protein